MPNEDIVKLVRNFENRISTFLNFNGMLEYQEREISFSQMKKSDEYQDAVDKAREDLYTAIEGLETNGI